MSSETHELASIICQPLVAGDVFPWKAANYTEVPADNPADNSTYEWRYLDTDFPDSVGRCRLSPG